MSFEDFNLDFANIHALASNYSIVRINPHISGREILLAKDTQGCEEMGTMLLSSVALLLTSSVALLLMSISHNTRKT